MADIFLSYAREDTNVANVVVRALKAAGFSVWIDRQVPTASKWEDILDTELGRARCIVMLWSAHAIKSHYVRHEGWAGFQRAALVPVLLSRAEIPRLFRSIQFADLTAWDGDPDAQGFREILVAVKCQMMPHPQIDFDSLFQLQRDDLKELYESYLNVAGRLGLVPIPGRFQFPKSVAQERRLHRAIASLQVTVDWDWRLKALFENSSRHPTAFERARRIERHIPVLWLGQLQYSGPFFEGNVSGPQTHENFLRFASLMFFHELFSTARFAGQRVEIPSPLTEAQLSFPRWEGAISAIFEDSDEIARAYVTHIDDYPLPREEVFYGPKYWTQKAFGRTLRQLPSTDPIWLERYMIPQRELSLALAASREYTQYRGNVRIRKITDLNGNCLLYTSPSPRD